MGPPRQSPTATRRRATGNGRRNGRLGRPGCAQTGQRGSAWHPWPALGRRCARTRGRRSDPASRYPRCRCRLWCSSAASSVPVARSQRCASAAVPRAGPEQPSRPCTAFGAYEEGWRATPAAWYAASRASPSAMRHAAATAWGLRPACSPTADTPARPRQAGWGASAGPFTQPGRESAAGTAAREVHQSEVVTAWRFPDSLPTSVYDGVRYPRNWRYGKDGDSATWLCCVAAVAATPLAASGSR